MAVDDASPQARAYPDNHARANPQTEQSLGPNPAMARNFHLQVRPELVVKPDLFTMMFGFFGRRNWERSVAYTMMERVENSWLLTGRSLTQDELDAFTTYSTRTLYYRRMGVPISSFLGTAYLYYKVRKDAGLPPNASPASLFAILRNQARVDKAGFRSMIAASAFKMLFITTTGAIVSGFTALYSETTNVIVDPRLRGFVEDMRGQKPEEVRQRKLKAASERARRMRGGEKDIEGYIVEELQHPGSHPEQSDQDSYAYESTPSGSDMTYSTPENDQQTGSAGRERPVAEAPRRSWGYGGQVASQQGASGQSSADSDFFLDGKDDDASPTAPEYRYTNPDGSPAGSAWDRLRRQNAGQSSRAPPSQQPRPQWGQQQDSPNSPSYTPAGDRDQYDSDRSREKEQAQADFDRMMEAERNLSSSGSPQNRGW